MNMASLVPGTDTGGKKVYKMVVLGSGGVGCAHLFFLCVDGCGIICYPTKFLQERLLVPMIVCHWKDTLFWAAFYA